jgi:nicotinate dehydrogenase subunit B
VNGPVFSRRQFTAGLGAIVVAFSLEPNLARGQERLPGSLQNNRRLDAWIRINSDGGATIFTGKVELGQGILTALAQIAAEELDLPLSRIEMISGDTGQTPNEGHTAIADLAAVGRRPIFERIVPRPCSSMQVSARASRWPHA